MSTFKEGLQDVVAATSSICFIDGDKGVLSYRGIDIHELAEQSSFEEVCYLLWFGKLPRQRELGQLTQNLAQNRAVPQEVFGLMRTFPRDANPMDVLRTAVSALAFYDPDGQSAGSDANLRKTYRLTGQIAGIVAATERIRHGQDPVEPDPTLKHAANFVYMLTGKKPTPTAEKAFDVALILHADHELNASTFAGRVTAATLSDVHSAVTAAIGALKGPLHGGANIDVMRMLLEIGEVSKVESWVKQALASKKKISGFGHRVYHTEDPRATHLRKMSRDLCESSGNSKWFEMSRLIEEMMKREKNINANVDFYSATVYYTLGIAVDLFTPIFAVSRISGWTAHILEQLGNNRLIRPRAEYLGPQYPAPYIPMAQR
ncbi:MAG: citrate synthase [Acidobacteria bacterium]|nr:citrate synthase [Acidobacteriota bacterium]MCI0621922.1 citrate synthase [Acidobacteriota bacterium]MCI0719930.1 citrate synthase [Acidobacteriota bacterium]